MLCISTKCNMILYIVLNFFNMFVIRLELTRTDKLLKKKETREKRNERIRVYYPLKDSIISSLRSLCIAE